MSDSRLSPLYRGLSSERRYICFIKIPFSLLERNQFVSVSPWTEIKIHARESGQFSLVIREVLPSTGWHK